jgi:hypothetical protein
LTYERKTKRIFEENQIQARVTIILLFIAFNDCLNTKDKIIFFMEFKSYLRIDWAKLLFVYFIYNKNTILLLGAQKIGLQSRDFCVFVDLFV